MFALYYANLEMAFNHDFLSLYSPSTAAEIGIFLSGIKNLQENATWEILKQNITYLSLNWRRVLSSF